MNNNFIKPLIKKVSILLLLILIPVVTASAKASVTTIKNSDDLIRFLRNGGSGRIMAGTYDLYPEVFDAKSYSRNSIRLEAEGKTEIKVHNKKDSPSGDCLVFKNFNEIVIKGISFINVDDYNILTFENIGMIYISQCEILNHMNGIALNIKNSNKLFLVDNFFTDGDSLSVTATINKKAVIQKNTFAFWMGGSGMINRSPIKMNSEKDVLVCRDNKFYNRNAVFTLFSSDFLIEPISEMKIKSLFKNYIPYKKEELFIFDGKATYSGDKITGFYFILDEELVTFWDWDKKKYSRLPGTDKNNDFLFFNNGFGFGVKTNYPEKGKIKFSYIGPIRMEDFGPDGSKGGGPSGQEEFGSDGSREEESIDYYR